MQYPLLAVLLHARIDGVQLFSGRPEQTWLWPGPEMAEERMNDLQMTFLPQEEVLSIPTLQALQRQVRAPVPEMLSDTWGSALCGQRHCLAA
jgi:hypothetical protein